MTNAPKLDPREAYFRIPNRRAGLHLLLRHLPPLESTPSRGIVLYIHGGTFSSVPSIAHRFDGRFWRGTPVAGRPFLGHDGQRPSRRTLTRFERPHGVLRPDRPTCPVDRRPATARLETDHIERPMGPLHRRATHLMHLEENRYTLYRETAAYLTAQED